MKHGKEKLYEEIDVVYIIKTLRAITKILKKNELANSKDMAKERDDIDITLKCE